VGKTNSKMVLPATDKHGVVNKEQQCPKSKTFTKYCNVRDVERAADDGEGQCGND